MRRKSPLRIVDLHCPPLSLRYNPVYLADKASGFKETNFVPKAMGELVDLVTRYEPEVIWSDGDWEAPDGCGSIKTNLNRVPADAA